MVLIYFPLFNRLKSKKLYHRTRDTTGNSGKEEKWNHHWQNSQHVSQLSSSISLYMSHCLKHSLSTLRDQHPSICWWLPNLYLWPRYFIKLLLLQVPTQHLHFNHSQFQTHSSPPHFQQLQPLPLFFATVNSLSMHPITEARKVGVPDYSFYLILLLVSNHILLVLLLNISYTHCLFSNPTCY